MPICRPWPILCLFYWNIVFFPLYWLFVPVFWVYAPSALLSDSKYSEWRYIAYNINFVKFALGTDHEKQGNQTADLRLAEDQMLGIHQPLLGLSCQNWLDLWSKKVSCSIGNFLSYVSKVLLMEKFLVFRYFFKIWTIFSEKRMKEPWFKDSN